MLWWLPNRRTGFFSSNQHVFTLVCSNRLPEGGGVAAKVQRWKVISCSYSQELRQTAIRAILHLKSPTPRWKLISCSYSQELRQKAIRAILHLKSPIWKLISCSYGQELRQTAILAPDWLHESEPPIKRQSWKPSTFLSV